MDDKRATILWVDDEVDLLKSHIVFLEERGYKVRPVSNGADAVGLAGREAIDLVLLDQMMPGMDGLSTFAALKEMHPALPVVMITKLEEEELIDAALRRRIDDFLLKPVNPVQILSAVRRILESREIRQRELSREYVESFHAVDRLREEARGWQDWARIHGRLSELDLLLDEFPDAGLNQTQLDQRRQCNIEFAMFVERSYRSWVSGGDRPPLSVDVIANSVAPCLSSGRKVYFIIIDCLRLDQWLVIEPLLEPYFAVERNLYYSILPTATPYSRNAIFSGLFPGELAAAYPEYWSETESEDLGKNRFEKQLLEKQIKKMGLKVAPPPKYLKVYSADEAIQARKQIPTLQSIPLVAMVFNFVDIVAHSRSESRMLQEMLPDESAYRSFTRSWFLHSPLFDILKAISLQDAVAVVTTDHGAVLARRSAMTLGDRETSTNVRYKFGTNLNCDPRYALQVRNPAEYKLPATGVNKNYIIAKEDYYFVYPTNFHEYERQYKDSFQHGGVSMEEMILPCATLKPKR